MLSSLRKKLTEIRTDLSHKIDHLEVDKNHLLNKTQRSVDTQYSVNGINYQTKKDNEIYQIERELRENEQLCEDFERTVKQCLLLTTNFYHSMRTIEKELSLIVKSINTFCSITDKLEEFCVKLNDDLFLLEEIYQNGLDNLESKASSLNSNEEHKL